MSEGKQMGFGFAQTQTWGKNEWLTPPEIVRALGPFDLDPCSPIKRPWDTAKMHFTVNDDGLRKQWEGRVWLNPPYGNYVWDWLDKLRVHQDGIALIFARTGTAGFFKSVWDQAHSCLFLEGRLHFYHVNGTRAPHNCGADSVLVSYSEKDTESLRTCGLPGKLIILK